MTSTDTQTTFDPITVSEAYTLAQARAVLERIEKRLQEHSYTLRDNPPDVMEANAADCGRGAQACDNAESAIFDALNTLQAYCRSSVAEEWVHTKGAPE